MGKMGEREEKKIAEEEKGNGLSLFSICSCVREGERVGEQLLTKEDGETLFHACTKEKEMCGVKRRDRNGKEREDERE